MILIKLADSRFQLKNFDFEITFFLDEVFCLLHEELPVVFYCMLV